MVLDRYTKKYKVMRKKLKLKLGFRPSREMSPIPEEPEVENGDGDVDVNVVAPPPSPESTSPSSPASLKSSNRVLGDEDWGVGRHENEQDEDDEAYGEEGGVGGEYEEEEEEERKEMHMQMILYSPPLSLQSLRSRPSTHASSLGDTQTPSSSRNVLQTKPTKTASSFSKEQRDEPQEPTPNTTTDNPNSTDNNNDKTQDKPKINPLPYRASFITPPLGYGLIATQHIPAGSLIFADPIIYTSAAEQKACPTNTSANELLASKVRAMGPDWYRGYLTLTNPRRDSLGVFAGIWDAHQVPISGKSRGGMLGLNLAWVNHSCVPNCSVTVVQIKPPVGVSVSSSTSGGGFGTGAGAGTGTGTGEATTATDASTHTTTSTSTPLPGEQEKGEEEDAAPEPWIMEDGTGQKRQWDTTPRVIVRACTDILPGSEITIAYFFASGGHTQRELFTLSSFGFFCSCAACSIPNDKVERALRRLGAFNAMVEADDGVMVVQRPAAALQMAREVVLRLLQVRVSDSRVAMVWVRCALIAAFHSDVARAVTFLLKARKMLFVLEGPAGRLYGQVGRWCHDVRLVPGFGGTSRGVSSLFEGALMSVEMGLSEVLYMGGARADEYLRVGDYVRFEGAVLVFRDGKGYEVVGGSSLLEIELLPQCMVRSVERRRLKVKGIAAAASSSSSSAAAGTAVKKDTACKQEKDILDIMRGLRRQQAKTKKPSSLSPRKWMDGQREKDRAAAKAMLTAAPLVKSVGARKNVTVETSCVVCHGPMEGLQPHICWTTNYSLD